LVKRIVIGLFFEQPVCHGNDSSLELKISRRDLNQQAIMTAPKAIERSAVVRKDRASVSPARFEHATFGSESSGLTENSASAPCPRRPPGRGWTRPNGLLSTAAGRDLGLMALTHDVMILWRIRVLYRAVLTRFSARWLQSAHHGFQSITFSDVARSDTRNGFVIVCWLQRLFHWQ
jgi:hypothetical protein